MARVPLYQKAETEMLRRIRAGEWKVGHRLPNEFVLAEEFGVSQGTMRRALITLEGQGLLSRKPGRGTLVAKPKPRTSPAATRATPGQLRRADGAPLPLTVFRSRSSTRLADPMEAEGLRSARVWQVERTLKLGDQRAALDLITLPEALTETLDGETAVALPDLLRAHGLAPARIDDQISAEISSMSTAVALNVDRHTALLVLTRTAYDAADTPLATQTLKTVADLARYHLS